jgi:hypothetical protein
MKQPEPTPTRPDPNAKNEPAKRIETDDVRRAPEEGARTPGEERAMRRRDKMNRMTM